MTVSKADRFARYLHPQYCPEDGWTCAQTRGLIERILTADLSVKGGFKELHEEAKNHVYARALLLVRTVDAQVDRSIQKAQKEPARDERATDATDGTHLESLPFPTPQLSGLFSSKRRDLMELHRMLARVGSSSAATLHDECLRDVRHLLKCGAEGLSFFLAHPTRRLADALMRLSAEARAAVAWLAQNPPTAGAGQIPTPDYDEACERLQSGIEEWRCTIELKSMELSLEYEPLETLH